jgi:hypothetical protein
VHCHGQKRSIHSNNNGRNRECTQAGSLVAAMSHQDWCGGALVAIGLRLNLSSLRAFIHISCRELYSKEKRMDRIIPRVCATMLDHARPCSTFPPMLLTKNRLCRMWNPRVLRSETPHLVRSSRVLQRVIAGAVAAGCLPTAAWGAPYVLQ